MSQTTPNPPKYNNNQPNYTLGADSKIGSQTIREILESVRKGGYYDAIPEERKPDYADVDVAETAINAKFKEALGEKIDMNAEDDLLHSYHVGWNQAIDQAIASWGGK